MEYCTLPPRVCDGGVNVMLFHKAALAAPIDIPEGTEITAHQRLTLRMARRILGYLRKCPQQSRVRLKRKKVLDPIWLPCHDAEVLW